MTPERSPSHGREGRAPAGVCVHGIVTSTGAHQSLWSCPRTVANRTQTLVPLAPVTVRVLPVPTPSGAHELGPTGSGLHSAAYCRRVLPVSCADTRALPCPFLGNTTSIDSGAS